MELFSDGIQDMKCEKNKKISLKFGKYLLSIVAHPKVQLKKRANVL